MSPVIATSRARDRLSSASSFSLYVSVGTNPGKINIAPTKRTRIRARAMRIRFNIVEAYGSGSFKH